MLVCFLVLFNFGRGLFGVCLFVCWFCSILVGGCLVFVCFLVMFNFGRGLFGVCLFVGSVHFW